jgi:hypothetical protein
MPAQPPYGGPLAQPQYQQPTAPGWQAPPAPFAFAPQPSQALAVASLITGVAGFVLNFCCYLGVVTGPVAVGLGIVSLVQIKNNPKDYAGKPLAIIGIVSGALSFAGFLLLILWGVAPCRETSTRCRQVALDEIPSDGPQSAKRLD